MRYILYLQDGNIMGELDVAPPDTYIPAHELVECSPDQVIAVIQAYEEEGQIEREFTAQLIHLFFSSDKKSEDFISGFLNFVHRIAGVAYRGTTDGGEAGAQEE